MGQLDPDGAWVVWVPDADGMPGPFAPLTQRSPGSMPVLADRVDALAGFGYTPVDPSAVWTWEEFGNQSDAGPQLVGKLAVLPLGATS